MRGKKHQPTPRGDETSLAGLFLQAAAHIYLEPGGGLCLTFPARVGLGSMRRLLLAIILVPLASASTAAQVRDQKPVDWRTFEVPDFGTTIQYPAGIFSPAGSGLSALTDALSCPFTLVPMRPATIPQLT